MAQQHEESPMDNMVPDVEMQEQSPLIGYAPHAYDSMAAVAAPAPPPPNQQ
jgi:hypothetical protein